MTFKKSKILDAILTVTYLINSHILKIPQKLIFCVLVIFKCEPRGILINFLAKVK